MEPTNALDGLKSLAKHAKDRMTKWNKVHDALAELYECWLAEKECKNALDALMTAYDVWLD